MGTTALKSTVSVLWTQWLSIKWDKNEQNITEPEGKLKRKHSSRDEERERTGNEVEKNFEEIIQESFQSWYWISIYIFKKLSNHNRINIKKTTITHIIIKLLKKEETKGRQKASQRCLIIQSVITEVLRSETGASESRRHDDTSRGHSSVNAGFGGNQEPRNVGSLYKLEKARKRISPGASMRNVHTLFSPVTFISYFGLQNQRLNLCCITLSLW